MSKSSELFEVAAEIRHETKLAYLLFDGTPRPRGKPKAQVENNNDGTFTMPVWLAEKVGLV